MNESRLADAPLPVLSTVTVTVTATATAWDRIILTGMGSSHFAGIPTWRALTSLRYPVWTADTGQLLDNIGAITPNTLLIVTSQSGVSVAARAVQPVNGDCGWLPLETTATTRSLRVS